jgi:hypothetical protein
MNKIPLYLSRSYLRDYSPYKGENNKQEGVGMNSPSQARDLALRAQRGTDTRITEKR